MFLAQSATGEKIFSPTFDPVQTKFWSAVAAWLVDYDEYEKINLQNKQTGLF